MTIAALSISILFGLLPALIFVVMAVRGFSLKKAALVGEATGLIAGFLLMYTFDHVNKGGGINGYFEGIIFGQAIIVFGLILAKRR